jgi:hypothetical protein
LNVKCEKPVCGGIKRLLLLLLLLPQRLAFSNATHLCRYVSGTKAYDPGLLARANRGGAEQVASSCDSALETACFLNPCAYKVKHRCQAFAFHKRNLYRYAAGCCTSTR